MKRFLMAIAVAACSITVVQAQDNVSLRLHWLVNGTTSAFYLGLERGFFKDEKINLAINEGKGSVIAAQVVGTGSEPFGTSDAVSVIQAASKGVPIKAILVMQDVGSLGVIVLNSSGIGGLKDLEGKKLAVTAGDSLTQQWPLVVAANKLAGGKISLVYMDAATKPVALMEKRVDAMLGACVDHVVLVESKGHKAGCFPFADNGVPTIGITLIANEAVTKNNPDLVRRFVRATAKSLRAAYDDPNAAIDATAKAKPDIDREVLLRQAEIIKTMYGSKPIGSPLDAAWQNTVDVMRQTGSLSDPRPASAYVSTEFLPK